MSYTNADGLRVLTDADQGATKLQGASATAMRQVLVVDIPAFTAIKTTFGAVDIDLNNPYIPAGSIIMGATLVMTTGATGASTTLDIGTYQENGTAIAATGIDAAVALAAIDGVGETVRCDGTHTTTAGYIAQNAYIGLKWNVAAFTAGAGKLYVEYVKV